MMKEEIRFKQKRFPNRPLLLCPVCRKPGYEYIHTNKGHRRARTIHYNEQPIGIQPDGQPRYRSCSKGGRLYDTIQEGITTQQTKIARAKQIICPKCNKKGRLQDYTSDGVPMQVVIHKRIKGKTWGRKKVPQYERCWLGEVKK